MKSRKRLLFPVLINLILIIFFLLICLVPFIRSGSSWLISTLGLGFPYLLGLMLAMLVYWIFRLKRKAGLWMTALNLFVLILGFTQIRASIGFHFFSKSETLEKKGDIRVMSWNVTGWDIRSWDIKNHETYQPLMFDLIEQINPDVMLFQEFFNCTKPSMVVSYVKLLSERGYPYYFYSPQSITVNGAFQSGLAIFSKHPISDTAFFYPKSLGHAEGIQYGDIAINGRKYRFFNTHLESAGIGDDGAASSGEVGAGTFFRKLRNSHYVREQQAQVLKQKLNESTLPVILGGDFDDVPNSTVYFLLRKGLQDAFVKKGSGFGRTFRFIAPNLRIDYLFFSKNFEVNQFFEVRKDYSVHYPIVADLSD